MYLSLTPALLRGISGDFPLSAAEAEREKSPIDVRIEAFVSGGRAIIPRFHGPRNLRNGSGKEIRET